MHNEEITTSLAAAGIEDLRVHFLPRRKPWSRGGQTWSMLRGGREVKFRTNYCMGTDLCLFQNVSVRDACHNTYHYLVLGCLHITASTEHS